MGILIKLRSKVEIPNLDAMHGKDAFLTATFTDLKVLPYSGVIRYFGEFWSYDENNDPIPDSMREVELVNKREPLEITEVDSLFQLYPVNFSEGGFSANLETFIRSAFINKVAKEGRYKLSLDQLEFV